MATRATPPPADPPPAPAPITPPATPPPAPDPAPATGSLQQQVAAALGNLLGSGKAKVAAGDKPPAAGDDIGAKVKAAVREARTEDQRDSVVAGLQGQVEQLKAQLEKPPAQTRPVERFMKWRLPDES